MKKIIIGAFILVSGLISMSFVKSNEDEVTTIVSNDGKVSQVLTNELLEGLELGGSFEVTDLTMSSSESNPYLVLQKVVCPGTGIKCNIAISINGGAWHDPKWLKGKENDNIEYKGVKPGVKTQILDPQ
jgi:hypothetical protein